MRFEIPGMVPGSEFDAFADCVDFAVGTKSKREEGEFLIALSSFVARLVANVAAGRSVPLLTIGVFATELKPIGKVGHNGHGAVRPTPVFISSEGFQLEVEDPLPPDHVSMKGLCNIPDEGQDEPLQDQ